MKICCLLTGRGNNSLKDKNVLDVLGHPVLYYGANACIKANVFDHFYCSSDDEKILCEAEKLGYERIVRPLELASPSAQHIDCIMHALKVMKERNYTPDILCVLLANNVTVTSKMVNECVNELVKNYEKYSSIVPAYNDNDHHPLRCKRENENGELISYTGEKCTSTNRQDLPKCYFIAHNIWVINVKRLLSNEEGDMPWAFLGNNVKCYEIDESIDIHDKLDLVKAAHWIKENYID